MSSVWALSQSGKIYVRIGVENTAVTGHDWQDVSEGFRGVPARDLAVDGAGRPWVCGYDGRLWMRNGVSRSNVAGTSWVVVEELMRLNSVAVSKTSVWGITIQGMTAHRPVIPPNHAVTTQASMLWASRWNMIGRGPDDIFARLDDLAVWGITPERSMVRRDGLSHTDLTGRDWQNVRSPNRASPCGVVFHQTSNSICCFDTSGNLYVHHGNVDSSCSESAGFLPSLFGWGGSEDHWQVLPVKGKSISLGPIGDMWIIDKAGNVKVAAFDNAASNDESLSGVLSAAAMSNLHDVSVPEPFELILSTATEADRLPTSLELRNGLPANQHVPLCVWHTKTSKDYGYRFYDKPVGKKILVWVQAKSNAHVCLSPSKSADVPLYEIALGFSDNLNSGIRRKCRGTNLSFVTTRDILHPTRPVAIWIQVVGNRISVGKGENFGIGEIMHWVDQAPLPVQYVGVSTGWGSEGDWFICQDDDYRPPPAPSSASTQSSNPATAPLPNPPSFSNQSSVIGGSSIPQLLHGVPLQLNTPKVTALSPQQSSAISSISLTEVQINYDFHVEKSVLQAKQ